VQTFGNYAVCDPVIHYFAKNEEWHWKIKPPTSGDELAMSRFLVQNRIELGPDGVRHEFPPTNMEIMYREIALTFAGTNIPADMEKPVEDGGAAFIPDNAKVETIEACLRLMPHPMVVEIWDAVGDAVVGWGPVRPKAPSSESN
jgi:hypothetical protein